MQGKISARTPHAQTALRHDTAPTAGLYPSKGLARLGLLHVSEISDSHQAVSTSLGMRTEPRQVNGLDLAGERENRDIESQKLKLVDDLESWDRRPMHTTNMHKQ